MKKCLIIALVVFIALDLVLIQNYFQTKKNASKALYHYFNGVNLEMETIEALHMGFKENSGESGEYPEENMTSQMKCCRLLYGIDSCAKIAAPFKGRKYDTGAVESFLMTSRNVCTVYGSLSAEKQRELLDSIIKVSEKWTQFPWDAMGTLGYYDFNRDPENLIEHLEEVNGLAKEETDKLEEFI